MASILLKKVSKEERKVFSFNLKNILLNFELFLKSKDEENPVNGQWAYTYKTFGIQIVLFLREQAIINIYFEIGKYKIRMTPSYFMPKLKPFFLNFNSGWELLEVCSKA